MAGPRRKKVHPDAAEDCASWNQCLQGEPVYTGEPVYILQGLDMERTIQLVGQARTIPLAQLVLVRAMPGAFPSDQFRQISSMEDVKQAKEELGDAKLPILYGILAATCTKHHRAQMLKELNMDEGTVRKAIRTLVEGRGRLKVSAQNKLKKAGRGSRLKLKSKKKSMKS